MGRPAPTERPLLSADDVRSSRRAEQDIRSGTRGPSSGRSVGIVPGGGSGEYGRIEEDPLERSDIRASEARRGAYQRMGDPDIWGRLRHEGERVNGEVNEDV